MSTFIITVRYGLYICAVKVNVLSRQSENFSVPILCFCMRTNTKYFPSTKINLQYIMSLQSINLWDIISFYSGAAPSTISINVLSSTSLFMFWTPPVPGNQLQSYNVSYGVADLPERTSRMELTTFLSLFNLEEFTVYEFTIRGMFFNGVEGLPLVSTATTLEAREWWKHSPLGSIAMWY